MKYMVNFVRVYGCTVSVVQIYVIFLPLYILKEVSLISYQHNIEMHTLAFFPTIFRHNTTCNCIPKTIKNGYSSCKTHFKDMLQLHDIQSVCIFTLVHCVHISLDFLASFLQQIRLDYEYKFKYYILYYILSFIYNK